MIEGDHPREWIIGMDKILYTLKETGLAWFKKLKEVLDSQGFIKSQLYPCVWYIEVLVYYYM